MEFGAIPIELLPFIVIPSDSISSFPYSHSSSLSPPHTPHPAILPFLVTCDASESAELELPKSIEKNHLLTIPLNASLCRPPRLRDSPPKPSKSLTSKSNCSSRIRRRIGQRICQFFIKMINNRSNEIHSNSFLDSLCPIRTTNPIQLNLKIIDYEGPLSSTFLYIKMLAKLPKLTHCRI